MFYAHPDMFMVGGRLHANLKQEEEGEEEKEANEERVEEGKKNKGQQTPPLEQS